MAGLGNAASAMAGGNDPAGGAAPDAGTQQGTPASPKEEAALEAFMQAATEVMCPKGNGKPTVFPQIMADLKGQFQPDALKLFSGIDPPLTDAPDDCVAATAVLVTWVVDQKMGLLDQAIALGNQQGAPQGQQGDPGAPQPTQPDAGQPMPGQQDSNAPPAPMQPQGAGDQEPDPSDPNEGSEDGETEGSGPDQFDPEAVIMAGGHQIVQMLATLSGDLGLKKFSDEDTTHTFYRALDLFRWSAQGMKPAVVDALKQGFKQLVAANQQGKLHQILPGLPGGGPDTSPSSQQAPAPAPAQQGA